MRSRPSLRSRVIAWLLWRLRVKRRFTKTEGLRERVLQSRPKKLGPPRSFSRRFRIGETMHGDRPIFTLSPRKQTATMRVLYLHGGAYVYEIAPVQWKMIARLIDLAGVEVTVPLFPLAPEHTCVEVLAYALASYDLLRSEAPAEPIAFLGDSAGGGLALALTQQLRDTDKPQPACLVLVSPWLDVTCSDPSQVALDKLDPLLAPPGLQEQGRWYAGDLDPADPRVSPVYGEVHDLPPMMVLTGTHDLLHADARRLQAKFAGETSACTLVEGKDMLHVWPAMPIPEAREALEDIAAFLKANEATAESTSNGF